jgi:hypothetical protein
VFQLIRSERPRYGATKALLIRPACWGASADLLSDRAPRARSGGGKDSQSCGKRRCPAYDADAGAPSTLQPSRRTQPPSLCDPKVESVLNAWKKDASRCCGLRHLLHDVPPLQLVPSGRKPFIAAESGMGLVSLRITARPALGQVEILNVNISTSLGAYRRKAQRAKIVILEILGRLSRNDLWQT